MTDYRQLAWKHECDFRAALTTAFKAIRKHKIVARQNFSCCGGCAAYEIGTLVEERPNMVGGCYYHRQDAAGLPFGHTHVGYGAKDDGPLSDTEIGRIIRDELVAAGLQVTWNGKSTDRLRVDFTPPPPPPKPPKPLTGPEKWDAMPVSERAAWLLTVPTMDDPAYAALIESMSQKWYADLTPLQRGMIAEVL